MNVKKIILVNCALYGNNFLNPVFVPKPVNRLIYFMEIFFYKKYLYRLRRFYVRWWMLPIFGKQ